jgi:hypothetical protein
MRPSSLSDNSATEQKKKPEIAESGQADMRNGSTYAAVLPHPRIPPRPNH